MGDENDTTARSFSTFPGHAGCEANFKALFLVPFQSAAQHRLLVLGQRTASQAAADRAQNRVPSQDGIRDRCSRA